MQDWHSLEGTSDQAATDQLLSEVFRAATYRRTRPRVHGPPPCGYQRLGKPYGRGRLAVRPLSSRPVWTHHLQGRHEELPHVAQCCIGSAAQRKVRDMIRHRFHALCPYFAMFPESFAEY